MKALVDKVEPLIWLLFGAGFMVGCLILPAYVFVIGVAAPLGWLPPEALAWERAHGLASHPLGRLVLLSLIVLFPKSQPTRMGPFPRPPLAVFPPLLIAAWLGASAVTVAILWGVVP